MILSLPIAGFCYQTYASWRDEKNAPGELVDVGGHHLHFQSKGISAGQPTVIIETGIWDCSQSWQLVQEKLAEHTRVCSYDRAGYGWSEKSPHPRTFEQMAIELQTLLEKKGVQPPYILIGHSLGGSIVRMYQNMFPEKVAGIVFVDPLIEKPNFSPIWKVVSKAFSFLAYFGLLRLLFRFSPPLSTNPAWTCNMQQTYVSCHQSKTKTLLTCLQEAGMFDESFKNLKKYPIQNAVVVSRDPSKAFQPGVAKEKQQTVYDIEQNKLRETFPLARFVMAKDSGHLIQLDRPDIIIEETIKMISNQ